MLNDDLMRMAPRLSHDGESLADTVNHHLKYTLGKRPDEASSEDLLAAVSHAVRQYAQDVQFETEARVDKQDAKRLYYLSMEFLMGRLLGNNLHNLGLYEVCREVVEQAGFDLEDLSEQEADPALGNGGLGRLAACFLDSLATLGMPGYGYGINYEFGLFRQEFRNGFQVERPDHWLTSGTPWQIERPTEAVVVPLYGRVEESYDRNGEYNPMWMGWQVLIGVPHDMPVVGYGGDTVNFLRLYSARSSDEFDMSIFNEGDYFKAVERKISSETISKVLYPTDTMEKGKELRLVQEYFFVACAIRDIVRRYQKNHDDFSRFADKVALQLNDTHPALAVAELMRTFVDEHEMPWEDAWEITRSVCAYTNHTLLPEALETWSVSLFERVLPRHLQVIYEINQRFMGLLEARYPGDDERKRRMSIIAEGDDRRVRMAHLSLVGSHAVNGVATLHTELVKQQLLPDFYDLWPERFSNKTNGVTQRRWLLKCNPSLADLITSTVGDGWITDLTQFAGLEAHAEKKAFRTEFRWVKLNNKKRFARFVHNTMGVAINPHSLFDVQIKRIHEYKRQLLNAMNIIHTYLRAVDDGEVPETPRTWIFGGKAAPGYDLAKLFIKLINNLGEVINYDPRVSEKMKVVFVPDYRVTVAEKIIPAADLSEQISTAGFEASGTGNMKLSMNGALTIGTLDGANVEIGEEVGGDNIYIFGRTAGEVARMRAEGYSPWDFYHSSWAVKRVMDAIASDRFCAGEKGLFQPIWSAIMEQGDFFFHLADLDAYIEAHDRAAADFLDEERWDRMAILNVARMAKFSSDRSIQEYADEIWDLESTVG